MRSQRAPPRRCHRHLVPREDTAGCGLVISLLVTCEQNHRLSHYFGPGAQGSKEEFQSFSCQSRIVSLPFGLIPSLTLPCAVFKPFSFCHPTHTLFPLLPFREDSDCYLCNVCDSPELIRTRGTHVHQWVSHRCKVPVENACVYVSVHESVPGKNTRPCANPTTTTPHPHNHHTRPCANPFAPVCAFESCVRVCASCLCIQHLCVGGSRG